MLIWNLSPTHTIAFPVCAQIYRSNISFLFLLFFCFFPKNSTVLSWGSSLLSAEKHFIIWNHRKRFYYFKRIISLWHQKHLRLIVTRKLSLCYNKSLSLLENFLLVRVFIAGKSISLLANHLVAARKKTHLIIKKHLIVTRKVSLYYENSILRSSSCLLEDSINLLSQELHLCTYELFWVSFLFKWSYISSCNGFSPGILGNLFLLMGIYWFICSDM